MPIPKILNRWAHGAGEGAMGVFIYCTLTMYRIFGPRLLNGYFKTLAHIPAIRHIAIPVWSISLRKLSRLGMAIEWMDWVCARWPHPEFLLSRAHLHVGARLFSKVDAFLKSSKDNILAQSNGPRYLASLVDLEAALAIELGKVPPEAAFFAVGRGSAIAKFCYQRAWDAHSAMDPMRMQRYLNYYLRIVNYDVQTVIYIVDTLMFPNGLWRDIIGVLEETEERLQDGFPKNLLTHSDSTEVQSGLLSQARALIEFLFIKGKKSEQRLSIFLRQALACIEAGDLIRARQILDSELKDTIYHQYVSALITIGEAGKAISREGRAELERAFTNPALKASLRAELAGKIATAYEEDRDFDTARQYYVTSLQIGGVPSYLPTYLWRYASLCFAQGDYQEGSIVFDRALPKSWIHFAKLAKTPLKQRLKRNELIPPNGAFFIGCWGIGDDIIRMAMFDAVYDGDQNIKFGLSVDPRMQGLYARSFPNFEVVPVSRMNGPFAINETEYFRLRDGVPQGVDRGRVDINVFNAIKRYPDIALTEDMMNAFFRAGAKARRPNRPMLSVLPEKRESARRWLATLPPGLNVGISWRSGDRNVQRDKSYTDIVKDWGDVLSCPGINLVNLQYSWDPDELRAAESLHNCTIHMPPFDLKNDIEDILAMGVELDVVLAPCTAVRDMCAAAGANVWALAVTPFLPDLWRLDEDGKTDRLFPGMIHVTANEYGDAKGVLKEISGRLKALTMAAAPSTDDPASKLVT